MSLKPSSSPPWEVLLVAHHLDPKTLATASCVCKSWLNRLSLDYHWKSHCLTHHPSLSNLRIIDPAVAYRPLYALSHTSTKRRLQNPTKPHLSLKNLIFTINIRDHNSHIATLSVAGEDLKTGPTGLFQSDMDVCCGCSSAILVLEGVTITWNVVVKEWRRIFCMMDCEGNASFVPGAGGWFSQELPPPGCCSSEIASGLVADLRLGFCSGKESGG